MNHVKRVLFVSILLWAILLSACGPSTSTSNNTLNAIYTAAAQTIAAQSATTVPVATDTVSLPTATDSGSTTPTILPTLVSSLPSSTPGSSTGSSTGCNSTFVADATIPDGTAVSPGQTFVKTWTLQNTGSCTWDTNFTMRFFSGDQMSGGSGTVSSSVAPGGQGNVSVTLTAPLTAGTYTGNWRLADDSGITFGEIVDVVIVVNGTASTETPALTDTPIVYTATPTIPASALTAAASAIFATNTASALTATANANTAATASVLTATAKANAAATASALTATANANAAATASALTSAAPTKMPTPTPIATP